MISSSIVDVVIVGAGAAGIGAARAAQSMNLSYRLIEGSHRVGGRAYTESLPNGQPFDLGCHWLHSASINPLVGIADKMGVQYRTAAATQWVRRGFEDIKSLDGVTLDEFWDECWARMKNAVGAGNDASVADVTAREHPWASTFDYWISLLTSVDVDQVAAADLIGYNETDENWPVEAGYGSLIGKLAEGIPASLNCAATTIRRSTTGVDVETTQGTIHAKHAIVTVSTAVLGRGLIRFEPALPVGKQEAIAALQLGNHNRICLTLMPNSLPDDHANYVMALSRDGDDDPPMSFSLTPFGYDYVVGATGGRFADWLERAGPLASADYTVERLKDLFGTNIAKRVTGHNVTAWRGDDWIGGAYSASQPGQFKQRAYLALPVDERLHFAGEATSSEFFATAHGAYLSGERAMLEAGEALGVTEHSAYFAPSAQQ